MDRLCMLDDNILEQKIRDLAIMVKNGASLPSLLTKSEIHSLFDKYRGSHSENLKMQILGSMSMFCRKDQLVNDCDFYDELIDCTLESFDSDFVAEGVLISLDVLITKKPEFNVPIYFCERILRNRAPSSGVCRRSLQLLSKVWRQNVIVAHMTTLCESFLNYPTTSLPVKNVNALASFVHRRALISSGSLFCDDIRHDMYNASLPIEMLAQLLLQGEESALHAIIDNGLHNCAAFTISAGVLSNIKNAPHKDGVFYSDDPLYKMLVACFTIMLHASSAYNAHDADARNAVAAVVTAYAAPLRQNAPLLKEHATLCLYSLVRHCDKSIQYLRLAASNQSLPDLDVFKQ